MTLTVYKLTCKEIHDNDVRCLEQWTVEDIAEECWNRLKSGIISSAEELIGRGYCSNPE